MLSSPLASSGASSRNMERLRKVAGWWHIQEMQWGHLKSQFFETDDDLSKSIFIKVFPENIEQRKTKWDIKSCSKA